MQKEARISDSVIISVNSLKVLEERYLLRDLNGKVIETPDEMFRRVANNIAQADKLYDNKADITGTGQEFYEIMAKLEFLPGSPTLMNAGAELQQLSSCFVLPVEDSIESIFETLKNAAKIHQSGGGTGFSFSRLRPKNDFVKSTSGVSSGPVSFIKVYDMATGVMKQGGRRRGANIGVLTVDHPDILEFISAKELGNEINNFNLSVAITDDFMKAAKENKEYSLINPRTGEQVKKLRARDVFNQLTAMAWKTGEPGIIFIDEINRKNPIPALGKIESVNPCGEIPLLPYESCNIGSINLSKFVKNGKIDYEKLRKTIHTAVHFLDNVIDMNKYPLNDIKEITKTNRKIGLGIMGFADMLIKLGIAYDSEEGRETAESVMKFVKKEADAASMELAKRRWAFPNLKKSAYKQPIRNATRTAIAPTGSISMIADCSSGIEPIFAITYVKSVLDSKELSYLNEDFERIAKEKGFYSDKLMQKIAKTGTVNGLKEVLKAIQKVFVVAHDIKAEDHVRMQAVFQKYCDNAVSKTINLPNNATIKDVEKAFLLAYELGCKGVTAYRDKSRDGQVVYFEEKEGKNKKCIECN